MVTISLKINFNFLILRLSNYSICLTRIIQLYMLPFQEQIKQSNDIPTNGKKVCVI